MQMDPASPLVSTTPPYGQPLGLADRLREATQEVHEQAMAPRLVHHLLNGTLPSSLYLAYIDKLREIYTALEDAVALHPSHPHLSTTYNPSLLVRAPLLQSDCDYFLGEGVLPVLQVQVQGEDTGVQEYVERLRKLGTEDQESATLLLGHTYVRYLGDLSGGQVISKAVRKAYALPATGEGASFYEFEPMGDALHGAVATRAEARQLKNWFRDGIDAAGELMTELEREQVLEEAKFAFRMNVRLFMSFSGRVAAMEEAVASTTAGKPSAWRLW